MGKSQKKEWTAAGAARFARDARIATAAHLPTKVAQLWHISKAINAFNVHLAHLGDRELAMERYLGGLGYQRPWPEGFPEISSMLLSDEARYLAAADLYILSPQMCDVVVAAALTLTLDDLRLMTPGDLPTQVGLVVLPQPLLIRALSGDLGDDRAYTWVTPARLWPISGPGMHHRRALARTA